MSTVEALAREVGRLGVLLHSLGDKQWRLETRCPPLTVLELSAHVLRGAQRIQEMLARDPVRQEPERDALTYWNYDAAAESPQIAARAQEAAAGLGPRDFLKRWDTGWIAALRAARGADVHSIRPTSFGLMRVEDYLRTRVVEATVHHMDIRDALGREPNPDPEALGIAADVLRGLLGTDLRRAGMEDVRFLLVGTGRGELDERERRYLGPLTSKFPLIA